MKSKKAFTLIELLVVIAIIGILTTIAVVALNNARAKARDAKRIADVKQVQTALELFFNDNNRYPTTAEFNSGSLFSTSTVGTTTYMATIPSAATPPDGSCSASANPYGYIGPDNGSSYTLSFCLGGNTGSLVAGPVCATPAGLTNTNCIPPSNLTGLSLWLKADTGVTLNGSTVSSWADQSGNGNDAIQGTAGAQPLWVGNQINEFPIVRFDGVNDYLQYSEIATTNLSIFSVYKKELSSNNGVIVGGYYAAITDFNASSYLFMMQGNNYSYFNGGGNTSATLISALSDGVVANMKLYKNGIQQTAGSSDGTSSSFDFEYVGYRAYFDNWGKDDIAEIIIYDSPLSDADRQQVENYLNNKYAIY